ncbi:MAG TPA: M20/M25/M40 family metallo-hydrolase [Gemmatimonadales bacterium]
MIPLRTAGRGLAVTAVVSLLIALPSVAQVSQERVDLAVVRRIRDEGIERSQIDRLAGHLTDVIGPRLTGSPGMRTAHDWTAEELRGWGLVNVVVEPWGEFGRGWERVSYSGRLLDPFVQPLNAQPVAWTGSTRGTITAGVTIVQYETVDDLMAYRGKLRGAVVMMRAPPDIEPEFAQQDRRMSLDELLMPPEPSAGPGPDAQRARERFMQMRALRQQVAEMVQQEGVAAVLTPSSRAYGILGGGGSTAGRDPDNPEPPPELVVSQEQYAAIYRNVERGVRVRVELNVQNRFFADDLQAYNTLADIPGTDLADQYVMVGAHLDSWHYGTGATDNAAGSIVMMEALRILNALNLTPRRTIRIGLWSGEEQGLLGSRAWVENHPALHDRISVYVNVDNGTGKIRGIWDQMNEAAIPVFEALLWPFRDLGVVAVRHGNTGGTDHLSFDRAGIPGFNFIQDPIEYGTRTHHTIADTYDHLLLDDLKQAAVVVAATVYHLAMRDDMMPRKAATPSTN